MNKLFLPLRVLTVSVSLLTFSCTKEQVQVVNEKTVATKAALGEDSLEESANSKYVIDEGMVRQYYSRTAPGKRILSIEPYTGSGAVPLYVVNFDEGWNIVSSDSRSDFVLAKGEHGKFEMNIIHHGVQVWLANMQEQLQSFSESEEASEKDPQIWSEIRSQIQRDTTVNRALDPDQEYMWLVCLISQVDSLVVNQNIPHLMSTKWGQASPWNIHIPDNRLTGCVATAISQVLYYFHNSLGIPSDLYHTVTVNGYNQDAQGRRQYSVSRSDYTNNSPRWAQMPLDSLNSSTTTAGYVSDLMFDIGTRLGMWYGYNSSVVLVGSTSSWYDISPVNLLYNWREYSIPDSTYVIGNLTNSKPVLISAKRPEHGGGHTWVIDGYRKETNTRTKNVYYVKVPVEDVIDYDENYNVIYRASTLEDMLTIYPGFIEGTYQPIITISRREYYRMNWGYNGRHDDGLYTIVPSSNWYNYSTQAAIHYDLYPGQLLIGN